VLKIGVVGHGERGSASL